MAKQTKEEKQEAKKAKKALKAQKAKEKKAIKAQKAKDKKAKKAVKATARKLKKAQKAEARQAKKAAKGGGRQPGEKGGKKKLDKKTLILIGAAVAAVGGLVAFKGFGGGGVEESPYIGVEPPAQYEIGGLVLPAILSTILEDPAAEPDLRAYPLTFVEVLVDSTGQEVFGESTGEPAASDEVAPTQEPSEKSVENAEASPDGSEETEEPPRGVERLGYQYTEILDVPAMVQAYTTALTNTEYGFVYVDTALNELSSIPDLTTETGSVYLACDLSAAAEGEAAGEDAQESAPEASPAPQAAGDEPEPAQPDPNARVVLANLSWKPYECTLILTDEPGTITFYVPPETDMTADTPLSYMGAVDFIRELNPADLGLKGETMEAYRIYTRSGTVLVDDDPCMQLEIYSKDERTGTHVVAGTYFVSTNDRAVYKYDIIRDIVTPMPLS